MADFVEQRKTLAQKLRRLARLSVHSVTLENLVCPSLEKSCMTGLATLRRRSFLGRDNPKIPLRRYESFGRFYICVFASQR